MNIFQWILCPLLALAALSELIRLRRRWSHPVQRLARTAIWLAAMVAIAEPSLVTRFANAIGIGRGADVVLYAFVLAFLAVSFSLYSNQTRLQRRISKLVTHISVLEAQRGQSGPPLAGS